MRTVAKTSAQVNPEHGIKESLVQETSFNHTCPKVIGAGAYGRVTADQERKCQTDRLQSGVFIDIELIGDRA